MMKIEKIDLHMHSTVSDGTDTPPELLQKVRQAGIRIFALTDHDAIEGYRMIMDSRGPEDPLPLSGVEFSCEDSQGKYHILGYHFDPDGDSIRRVVALGHQFREEKLVKRLAHLKTAFGFTFPEEDVQALFALRNPGKPHIANLMVRMGYAENKEHAFRAFLNTVEFPDEHVRPEQAIDGILRSGGIPVLAHPVFGSGDELIIGEALDRRVRRLMDFGLRGLEGFYSAYTPRLRKEVLVLAERYDLLVTAGSDYHGKNKLFTLGNIALDPAHEIPAGLRRFLEQTVEA